MRSAWTSYSNYLATVLPIDDQRHDLASEVAVRLEQMEICMRLIQERMTSITSDPALLAQTFAYIESNGTRLVAGEISEEQYFASMPTEEREPGVLSTAFSHIRLFTESFYNVAWRIREIFNSPPPRKMPGLTKINSVSIRVIRNHLIQHPELANHKRPFRQEMLVMEDGPSLKSSAVLLKGGRTTADIDSIDKGLFVNASTFVAELQASVARALAQHG